MNSPIATGTNGSSNISNKQYEGDVHEVFDMQYVNKSTNRAVKVISGN